MKNDNRTHQISRRKLLKASGATIVSASIGLPAILSAQSKSVKIGFIHPTSGFLAMVYEHQVTDTNMDFDEAMQIVISGGLLTEEISKKKAEN